MVQALQGANLDERVAYLHELMKKADPAVVNTFRQRLDISWMYHDSALDGVVYTQDELFGATDAKGVTDPSLVQVYDEITQHRSAIDYVRELSQKKRFVLNLDVIKNIYVKLAPEEAEGRGGPKYRKDIPVHRLYFHEIVAPDKISYRMRLMMQWANAPETTRSVHILRLASKAHHQFLSIYPFPKHSGKLGRLMMNLMLMRHGYPPAIIHATERQRYYDALRGDENATAVIVHDAMVTSVESTVRYFEEAGTPLRGRRVRTA